MKCLLTEKSDAKVATSFRELSRPQCPSGHVLIRSHYSGVNYKDALAVTGKGAILKSFPLIAGIDVSGEVVESQASGFKPGDLVLITGCGLGETHNGGFSEFVVENANNVIAIPKGLNARTAMIIGTAGFTAVLAVERLLQNGQNPEKGPILVTGASGGVGQIAVKWLSLEGFAVTAVSGKPEFKQRLKDLGAQSVVDPIELPKPKGPLGGIQWGGAIDNVGGETLTSLLAHCQLWGNVASIGLADSYALNSTVMPFILRGVSLLGVSSNNTPRLLREKIWQKLSARSENLDLESFVSKVLSLKEVVDYSWQMLDRKTHGRALIKLA